MTTGAGTIEALDILLWVVNILGILFAFVASLLIKRLYDELDSIALRVAAHREDLLMNYPNHKDILELKRDIAERLDNAVHDIKNSVQASVLTFRIEDLQTRNHDAKQTQKRGSNGS